MKIYEITPIGKPRMTQRDRWHKRPATAAYWAYKEHVRLLGISTSNPVIQPVQQGSGKTDQILQQILDNQKRGHAQGLVVYNNTGGNAIVSSTQLGGFG
ncbi:hypothetical protein CHS65_004589 [Salmonella enterica]|nr:hypothetical protein [Salmonella enterica]EGH9946313.1 hypothetical protein [Salmonella enterica]EGJ4674687.1 hypothetical protein [Salmonella enterica]